MFLQKETATICLAPLNPNNQDAIAILPLKHPYQSKTIMSLKSFLSKIWIDIQSLFNSFPADLKTAVHIGVVVTEAIKNFIDSPTADVFTAIIPGSIDDEIKDWLRCKLPEILTELKLADNCSPLLTPQQITVCSIKILQGLDGDLKSAFLHNLSIMIAQVAADGKLTWSDGVMIIEWYYQHKFKNSSSLSN